MLTFLQLKPQNANYFSQITPVFSLSITVENGFVFNLPRTAGPIFRTLDVIASGENSIFQDLFDSLGDDVFAQRFDIYIAYSEGNIPVTANCWQGYLIESIQFLGSGTGLKLQIAFKGSTGPVMAEFGTVVQENTRPILFNLHRQRIPVMSVDWQTEGF